MFGTNINKHVHLQNCLRHALWWFLSRSNTLFSEFYGRLCIKDVVGTNHSRFIRAFFPSGMVTCEPRISYQVWTLDFAQFNWHVPISSSLRRQWGFLNFAPCETWTKHARKHKQILPFVMRLCWTCVWRTWSNRTSEKNSMNIQQTSKIKYTWQCVKTLYPWWTSK